MEFITTSNSTSGSSLSAHTTSGVYDDPDIINNNPFCDF